MLLCKFGLNKIWKVSAFDPMMKHSKIIAVIPMICENETNAFPTN